jgi:hypothetical protein
MKSVSLFSLDQSLALSSDRELELILELTKLGVKMVYSEFWPKKKKGHPRVA